MSRKVSDGQGGTGWNETVTMRLFQRLFSTELSAVQAASNEQATSL
jgi:hypothetical protein